MPYCRDGRWHATQAEADACTHHPDDKDFATLYPDLTPRRKRSPRTPRARDILSQAEEDINIDDDDELPGVDLVPETPAFNDKRKSTSASPSPKRGYPTPPFSQEVEEDIGDNIIVAMSSSPFVPASSPAPAVRWTPRSSRPSCGGQMRSAEHRTSPVPQHHDDDDDLDSIPGPLSSSLSSPPPSLLTPTEAATTRVPETELIDDTIQVDDNNDGPRTQTLENDLLALRADRARLTDSLASSTFQIRNLVLRTKLHHIETQLAERDAAKARAGVARVWETVDAARQARRNATMSFWILVGLAVVWVGWCWMNRVEMAYVRSRRCGVFGLDGGC